MIGSSREFILHFRACSIVGCDPPALSWPTRVTHKENIDKESKSRNIEFLGWCWVIVDDDDVIEVVSIVWIVLVARLVKGC